MFKSLITKGFNQLGFDLCRLKSIPFGVNWCYDIRYFLNGGKLGNVFDIGANVGQTVEEILKYFPDSEIFAFEPVPNTFKELVTRTKNLSKKVKVYNAAVGDEVGQAPITTDLPHFANTLRIDVKANRKTVEVDVETIENFCQVNSINKIGLLKTDTEGFDLKVLKGAKSLLSEQRIDFVLTECRFFQRHENKIPGDFLEILNYLQSFSYNLVSFYTDGVDDLGWYWGNALFRSTSNHQAGKIARSPFANYREK